MDDPIGGHPTRGEQLDILVSAADAMLGSGDAVLDLGCGTGFLAHLLFEARADIRFIGVDRKGEALDAARARFGKIHGARAWFIEGDLTRIGSIEVDGGPFKVIATALTFHDLADADKRSVLAWARGQLAPGGALLVYDRLRLSAPSAFPMQRAIWRRIERVHGRGMRAAESFAAYEADLSDSNRPARLDDYVRWFAELGLEHQILHLHGNVALIAAVRGEETP